MLSVTGLNRFYYVRDFTDMRCKHSRVLSIIHERLHREPNDGDVLLLNYSAGMAEDQKDRYIQYLAEQNQDLRLTGDAMKLVLEDFMAQMKELKDQMSSMQSKHADLENRFSEEHKLRKSAERKIKSLQERLDYANQERFGDRRQKIKSKAKTDDSDRNKEKDDYDGTDDTLRTDSVDQNPSKEVKEPSKKERDLSNRPDGYKTMGVAGESIKHPSDLAKVPGRIIERRMVRVYSFRTFLTEECFEMVHYAEPGKKPKWGYFPSEGHPEVVTFPSAIFFYENGSRGREVLTDFLGDAELKSIMSDGYNAYVFIGNELKSAQFKDTIHQVCMSHAKNKFVKASNQGSEPNAERFSEILKEFFMRERRYDDAGLSPKERFPTQRNNSLHYGSDAGAEMAATYHSVIGTVKLHGNSVWNFIGTFFKNIFNGCRDYVNMVPGKITLATGQC